MKQKANLVDKQVWVVRVRYGNRLITCMTHFKTQQEAVKFANICGYRPNEVSIERTR